MLLNDQPTALLWVAVALTLMLGASRWPDDVSPKAHELGGRVWQRRQLAGAVVVLAVAFSAYRMRSAMEESNWTGSGLLFTTGLVTYLVGLTLTVARHLGVGRPRRAWCSVLSLVLLGTLLLILWRYGWAVVPAAVVVLATVLASGLFWRLGLRWPWMSAVGIGLGIVVPLAFVWFGGGAPVAILLALAVVATEALVISHVPDPSPRAVLRRKGLEHPRSALSATMGAIGVALCLLSGVLLSLAAVRLSADRANTYASEIALDAGAIGNDPALGRLESCGQASATTGVPAPQLDRDNRLVCRYRPILRLAQTDGRTTLLASAVETEVGNAPELEPLEGHGTVPADCPTTLDDVGGSGAICARVAVPDVRQKELERVTVGGATYAAIHHRADAEDWPLDGVETIIQYWLFYVDNAWRNPTALGPASQDHRGDWEFVSVALDRKDEPVAISYSAHCGGTRRPWARVPVLALAADGRSILVGEDGLSGTHPLVVVAAGSHANYPVVGRREADWTSCALNDDGASPPKRALLQVAKRLTFVGNGLELIPAKGVLQIPDVRLPQQAQRVLQAPWYWGLRETMTLSGIPITDESHGPDSPGFKDDYKHPWTPFTNTTVWACDVKDDCDAMPGAG